MATFTKSLAKWGTRPAQDIDAAADQLLTEARAASKLRRYRNDPDVAALTIEHTRERVERVLLIAMTCGLLYTTVNVQGFIAGTAVGVAWYAAWLVEPFITAGVLALLRIEQVARRNHVRPEAWVHRTRWAAFAATYTFNTWSSWLHGIPSEIVKHSVIPILVFCFAEALTDGRDALTKAAALVAGSNAVRVVETLALPPEPPQKTLAEKPPTEDAPTEELALEELDTEPSDQDAAPVPPRHPKGYIKGVAIPAAYRELADEAIAAGEPLSSITLTDVDRRAGTNKYVTRAMIDPLREQYETERKEGLNGVRV